MNQFSSAPKQAHLKGGVTENGHFYAYGTPEYEAYKAKKRRQAQAWRDANPDKCKAINKRAWKNNKVGRVKSMYKWRAKQGEFYLEYRRKWTDKNKDRLNGDRRERYETDDDFRLKILSQCEAMRIKHGDRWNELRREDYKENPDKYRERYRRAYERNPAKFKARSHARRAKLVAATVGDLRPITEWDKRWHLLELVRCYWCQEMVPPDYCNIDHMVAIDLDGPHCIENLCISCSYCNHSKWSKSLHDWNKKLKEPVLEWNKSFI